MSANSGVFTRTDLAAAKRIVVKVGSSLLTSLETGLEQEKIQSYCRQIAQLMSAGKEVILVSSGAIAEGCMRLGWSSRPAQVHRLQAAAAVGQIGLLQAYEETLKALGCGSAMIMLTHEDLADRQRYLNARATLKTLTDVSVVPIINENDTVATDEIRFGDNDTLAALVANLVEADLLVILTDVAGLFSADPRLDENASRIENAAATDAALAAMAGDSAGTLGRGGMVTKIRAARLAARSGAHTVIASGHVEQVLGRLLGGENIGTLLYAEMSPLAARKRWIAGQLRAKGDIVLDPGAVNALQQRGVSLLAAGIVDTRGSYGRGDVVRCVDQGGVVIAQGLSNYAAAEVAVIKGLGSDQYAAAIGYAAEAEVVHRDNLVLV
ncbi:MAG: glutamate 5-kinase [Proteobacteria bacterium]|nr:glutamate 5-kinase [Pseudomonadota bacterium]